MQLAVEEKISVGIPKLKEQLGNLNFSEEDIVKISRLFACIWVADAFNTQGNRFNRLDINDALRKVIHPHFSWHAALNYLKTSQAVEVVNQHSRHIVAIAGAQSLEYIASFFKPNQLTYSRPD